MMCQTVVNWMSSCVLFFLPQKISNTELRKVTAQINMDDLFTRIGHVLPKDDDNMAKSAVR